MTIKGGGNRWRVSRREAVAALAAALSMPVALPRAWSQTVPPAMSVFDLPALVQQIRLVTAMAAAGQGADAEAAVTAALGQAPGDPARLFLMAVTYALGGKTEVALHALDKAAGAGFAEASLVSAVTALAQLAGDARFQAALQRIASNAPAGQAAQALVVGDGPALVDASNTVWDGRRGVLLSRFTFSARSTAQVPAIAGDPALSARIAAGEAAGNRGDLYDNRDQGHARLDPSQFHDVAFVDYAEAARQRGLHDGPNVWMRFNAPSVGNCSKALVSGPAWRSMARLMLTQPGGPAALFDQYVNAMLYVYPAHRDHDPDPGDVFPANTPYMIASQGSSGSDLPFVSAVLKILAALKPEVKRTLAASGLLMPTVQMIFRRGQSWVKGADDYLSGAAHPSVFDAAAMNEPEMVARAAALTLDTVPPLVALSVVEEDKPVPGVEVFEPDSQAMFDTPAAIARAFRTTSRTMRLVVEAKPLFLPGSEVRQELVWTLLRGSDREVSIRPLAEDGSKAEITVGWQARRRVPGRPELMSDRIDIGVFGRNGEVISAPSFVSVVLPGDQRRDYDEAGRPLQIEYTPPALAGRYVDPAIFARLGWSDTYRYDAKGNPTGWTRERGGERIEYSRDGARIVERDTSGRPVRARLVRYTVERSEAGRPQVKEQETGADRRYVYSDDRDMIGRPVDP
jgi:hypothetical protein